MFKSVVDGKGNKEALYIKVRYWKIGKKQYNDVEGLFRKKRMIEPPSQVEKNEESEVVTGSNHNYRISPGGTITRETSV